MATKQRLLSTVGICLLGVAPNMVWAHETTDAAEPAASNDALVDQRAHAYDDSQTIIVTGTRIQNSGIRSPTPLTVLGQDKILQTAPSAADDVLAQLPAFRPSSGPNQVQRNAGSISTGQSLANLRGLGSQRTLLLIDGQRVVPTNPQGTTSTSIIPVNLIQRVEVVTGGASAAYGSDAVAGVTNFVLADRIDGLRGSVYGGISDHGDNKEYGASFAYGFTADNDRLSVIIGADFNKNYGVGNIYERKWSAVEPGNSGNPISFGAARAAGTPAFGWANGVEYASQTPGGVINSATTTGGAASTVLNQLAFNPDGTTYRLVRGPVFGNLMIDSSSNPIATPLAQWNLKQPLTQGSGLVKLSYEINEDSSVFLLGNYAQSNVFTFSQFHQSPTITILANNPYLPAGIAQQMADNDIASFNMGRVDTEWLGTSADNTYTTWRISAGVKGKLFEGVKWDVSYNMGRSTIDSKVYGSREANLYAALYAVRDGSGNIVCGPIATNPHFATARQTNTVQPGKVQPGCVPINPFGAGNASQAAVDYVSGIEYTKAVMEQHTIAANLTGSLFELPGGPASFALGGELRWDDLHQTADDLQILGVYSSGNNQSYKGSNQVKEAYVELDLPVLADIPGIHSLSINAAARRTDYKISGPVTTWKLGGVYEPFDGLRFRITRSRDIRAPSLAELFSVGGISSTGSFFNPFNGQSARLPQQALGNPNLIPEKADTLSFGGSFEGRGSLSGLRLSVDYYRIKVKDVIASVSATDSIARCYAGNQTYCQAIEFDNSVFGIARVLVQPFNQSLLDTEGVDFEFGYRTGLDKIGLPGALDATLFATRLLHQKTTDIAGPNGVTLDYAGYQNAQSKWVVSAYLNYKLEPVTVGLQMRAFSKIGFSPLYVGPGQDGYDPTKANSINKNFFEGQQLFNLNLAYDFALGGKKAQIFGNVNNLFDTTPPEFALAAINLGGNPYDYVGRTYKLGVRFGF